MALPSRDQSGTARPARRILVVSDVFPWPARDGYRLRLSSVLESLASAGVVDLFVAALDEEVREAQEFLGRAGRATRGEIVQRCHVARVTSAHRTLGLGARTLLSRLPRRILWRDWTEARAQLRQFARAPYDTVWYSHADTFAALGHQDLGRPVVDLDNLESSIIAGSMTQNARGGPRRAGEGDVPNSVTRWAKRFLDWRDLRCWHALEAAITRKAAVVVVCSEDDRRRLADTSVRVVPNGYVDPGETNSPLPQSRTLVMVARFTYEPNLAGAQWLVREVLPILRGLVPDVEVRLVGRHDARLEALACESNVTVVGEVPDAAAELLGARAVVVPVRSGSGTRVKILEAWAHARPVVTTTLGGEGLGIEEGVQALVADDPGGFAHHCATLLERDEPCDRLRQAGRTHFLAHFEASRVRAQVLDVLQSTAVPERAS